MVSKWCETDFATIHSMIVIRRAMAEVVVLGAAGVSGAGAGASAGGDEEKQEEGGTGREYQDGSRRGRRRNMRTWM